MGAMKLLGSMALPRSMVAVSALALALAGCYSTSTPGLERAGERVRQAESPLIVSVEYQQGDSLGPEELTVRLVPTATEADRAAVWCEIIMPLGAASRNTYVGGSGVADDSSRRPSARTEGHRFPSNTGSHRHRRAVADFEPTSMPPTSG